MIGLDNRQLGQPGGTGTGDPPNANYLSPVAVAQLYDFPNTGAADQTIGIFDDAGAGAAYSHTDITDFISSLPGGYNTQPSLADIGLTVGATTYTNDTSLVTSSPTGAVGECTIDVSIAAAAAQGANINVYFSDASEQGWEAFFDRAINPPAGDNPPSALTNSWFSIFGDDPGQIGDPSVSGSIAQWMHTKLRSAHTRGITVFMAIGDWGSADQVVDGNCHVAYPHSDPAVTACGGTIVGNISPTGFEEFVWSEANTGSQFQNFPYESTGGGVSDNPGFSVPHYQKVAGVLPVSKNDGNARRGVPDVAGMVAMDGFFFAAQGGPGQYGFFGTSLVAPLYAGLTAVINAFLGRSTGFLNDIVIRFQPTSPGPSGATLTIYSNDLLGPHTVAVSGVAPAPRLVLAMADSGNMGAACTGSFVDEPLILNNSEACPLSVTDITSSSAEFQVPQVKSYPLSIGAGESVPVPIRFAPASVGPASATLTIISNDLASPASIVVTGEAPSGRLAVTGSTFFSGVEACRSAERTISICNVGDCKLHISSVRFRHPRRHWELVRNPFPAALHPGSCLSVVIRYKATERIPRSRDLIIDSDDPATPVRMLQVLAYTIWPDGCCRRCCDSCRKEPCGRRHCEPSCCRDCCEDRDFDEADLDQAGSLSGR